MHRTEYYERLQAIRDHGDWETWLAFFLQGIIETSRQATETAREILALRERHRQAITANFGRVAGNALRVLESLYKRPIVSVQVVRDLIGTTYPAANDLVGRLEAAGIIREITGQSRNRRFRYDECIRLFDVD